MGTSVEKIILLVDDNDAHRRLIRRAISKSAIGNEIVEAAGLHEAKAILTRGETPKLCAAVVDLNLGDGYGTEFISTLRAHAELSALPILAISTSTLEDDREKCLAAGANAFLAKSDDLLEFTNDLAQTLIGLLGKGLDNVS